MVRGRRARASSGDGGPRRPSRERSRAWNHRAHAPREGGCLRDACVNACVNAFAIDDERDESDESDERDDDDEIVRPSVRPSVGVTSRPDGHRASSS